MFHPSLRVASIRAAVLTGPKDIALISQSGQLEIDSQTLVANGASEGSATGSICEALCGYGRHYYENSCQLSFDPQALESAEVAAELRDKTQSIEESLGGSTGEGRPNSMAGNPGTAGAPTETSPSGGSAIAESWPVPVTCSGYVTEICEGRRHASWGPCENISCANLLGAWFARAASNEAGSVRSFRALERELRRTPLHGKFSARLRKAARDEIRHARAMQGEARRCGATRPRQAFGEITERSLKDVALENAREGCVFETYAALEMHLLAARASSPEHRAIFAAIAADETEHAELAWDLHEAFLELLSGDERLELQAALTDASDALQRASRNELPSVVHEQLGVPRAGHRRALRAQLAEQLRIEAEQMSA